MLRVTNPRRWRRTKLVLLAINSVALLWCIGGLEGNEPMPYPTAGVVLLGCLGYMVHNLTKQYK